MAIIKFFARRNKIIQKKKISLFVILLNVKDFFQPTIKRVGVKQVLRRNNIGGL